MNIQNIKDRIRTIPDFPSPGINFKDITPLLADPIAFEDCISIFYETFKNKEVDVVLGIESRGFIFGAPLALKLNCKFALARKPNKLPAETLAVEYDLEYGKDSLEMHLDSIQKNENVLIVDDLLATGGTANAVKTLVENLGGNICSFAFLIVLNELNGLNLLSPHKVFKIIDY